MNYVALTAYVALTDELALTDDVSRSYWTKMIMWSCLVTWQYVNGPKNMRTLHALHRMNALVMCSIQSELATLYNPECPNYFNLTAMIYSLYL